MKKLVIGVFVAMMAMFVVGCGDPGEFDDGMEGMEQQDGMGQDDAMGGQQDDGFGGQDDDFGGQDDGMGGDDEQQW